MGMVDFIGESYRHRSTDVSSQLTQNLYPELINNSGTKNSYVLLNTAGTKLFCDLGSIGVCRGLTTVASPSSGGNITSTRTFGVYGNGLYEINSDKSFMLRGELSNQSTRCYFADASSHLIVSDGFAMYALELEGNILTTITLPFEKPTQVLFFNGRVIAINADDTLDDIRNYNKFYWSNLNGPVTWDALDWSPAGSTSDPILSIKKRQGDLALFGSTSYECWRYTGNYAEPFSRVGGSYGEIGIGAIDGASSIINQVFWLGSSSAGKNQVFMLDGYNAKRISNHALESQLDKFNTTDCVSFTYQQEGHVFYVMNFIEGNLTKVYDLTTGKWHDRTTRDEFSNIENRWSPIFATFGNEVVLVGNSQGSQVLELDLNTYTDYPNLPVRRVRRGSIMWRNLTNLFHKEFTVDIETGTGLQSDLAQGYDPQIMLRYSDDGGHTFGSERWKSFGKIGVYGSKVTWRMLGRSRARVYEIAITEPVKITIQAARLEIEESTNR